MLTAHVCFPALDERPATMSAPALDLLRVELGFTGVIVSDALDMHGIGRGPGAVAALAAGVDLLCTGNPAFPDPYDDEAGYLEVRNAVVAARVDGVLDRRRVEEAGDRVAQLPVGREGADPAEVTVGADVARRVLDVAGDVQIDGGPHVLDLTAGWSSRWTPRPTRTDRWSWWRTGRRRSSPRCGHGGQMPCSSCRGCWTRGGRPSRR